VCRSGPGERGIAEVKLGLGSLTGKRKWGGVYKSRNGSKLDGRTCDGTPQVLFHLFQLAGTGAATPPKIET
jgi:hypothetical protein